MEAKQIDLREGLSGKNKSLKDFNRVFNDLDDEVGIFAEVLGNGKKYSCNVTTGGQTEEVGILKSIYLSIDSKDSKAISFHFEKDGSGQSDEEGVYTFDTAFRRQKPRSEELYKISLDRLRREGDNTIGEVRIIITNQPSDPYYPAMETMFDLTRVGSTSK